MFYRYSNVLTVEPLGGLCNRMRVIDAALAFSGEFAKPLRILWYHNHLLNCPFERLFEVPEGIAQLRQIDFYRPLAPLRYKLSRYLYPLIHQTYVNRRTCNRLVEQGEDFSRFAKAASLKITCCHRFHRGQAGYRAFKPVTAIENMIDACLQRFSDRMIGVHVRRSDHTDSIEHSHSSLFMELMQREVDRHDNTRFFLATDSEKEQADFIDRFGSRVIYHRKRSLQRSCPQAIEDALVDLMCLSRTGKIIGSFASSFTETAAEIGGIELVIARQQQRMPS